MYDCFSEKLGYLVVKEETNVSSHQLKQTLAEVEKLIFPKSYCRVFFYFFGHGNYTSIFLKDWFYTRADIIESVQKISSSDILTIFFFDCCRTITGHSPHTQEQDQNASSTFVLELGVDQNGSGKDFTQNPNTCIINATVSNSRAYYIEHLEENEMTKKEGNRCGLATFFFTKLAPMCNESLPNLLMNVRSEVVEYIKKVDPDNITGSEGSHPKQLVDYNDLLMKKVNFLAESTGTGNNNNNNAKFKLYC